MSEERKPEEELTRIMRVASEKAQRITGFSTDIKKLAQKLTDLSNVETIFLNIQYQAVSIGIQQSMLGNV
jgi:hypothetical protein